MANFKHSYALVIGVDGYQHGITSLNNAVNDARAVSDLLEHKHDYQVLRLFDQAASREAILRALKTELSQKIRSDDRLFFYFSGHGIQLNSQEGPEGYLIPQTARLGESETYLSMREVYRVLCDLPCRHLLCVLDCCFAGSFRWTGKHRKISIADSDTLYRETFDRFTQDPAWQVITSAAYDQLAYDAFDLKDDRGQDSHRPQHSPFAAALLSGLEGGADMSPPPTKPGRPPGDGVVTATELYQYVRDRIELETESHGMRQTPGLYPIDKHDRGEYIFLVADHPLNLPCAPSLDRTTNPYKGLLSFEENDQDRYFGRAAIAQNLYQFFLQHQLTVVLGASGSGKSSLVKAGLLPKIRNSQTNEKRWNILPPFRPESSPFQSLNRTLAKIGLSTFAPADFSSERANSTETRALESLKRWFDQNPDPLIVVIDQFEELVTRCKDEERERFLTLLTTVLQRYPQRLHIVVTLRSDFESQFQGALQKEIWKESRFQISPLNRQELHQVIEEPAALRVLFFDSSELVNRLIDEVINMPGGLPLLSFALSELYLNYLQRQESAVKQGSSVERAIAQIDYDAIGGVTCALIQRAEEEYAKLIEENAAYAQTIQQTMLRMVALGAGELARRPFVESEQLFSGLEEDRVKTVIDRFLTARLLVAGKTTEGEAFIEPAHDALVQGWPRLNQWLDQGDAQETVLLIRSLTSISKQWAHRKLKNQRANAEGLLWKEDPRLPQAMRLLFGSTYRDSPSNFFKWVCGNQSWQSGKHTRWLNAIESKFVQESFEKKLRSRRNLVMAVTSVGSLLLMLTGYAFFKENQASSQAVMNLAQAAEAQVTSGKELEASANAAKSFNQLQAIFSSHRLETQIAGALQKVTHDVQERNRFVGHEGQVHSVAISPNGKWLASAAEDALVMLWNMDSQQLSARLCGHASSILKLSFSPDSRVLASGDANGKVILWDMSQTTDSAQSEKSLNENSSKDCQPFLTRTLPVQESSIRSLAFSPNNATIAIGLGKGEVKIWDTAESKWIETLRHSKRYRVRSVDFSSNGQLLATASQGEIRLWNASDLSPRRTIPISEKGTLHLAFSPDSTFLAVGLENGTIKLWNVKKGRWSEKTLQEHASGEDAVLKQIRSIAFSPDGQFLMTSSADGKIRLWDWAKDKVVEQLEGHSGVVTQAVFALDKPNAETTLAERLCGSGYVVATGSADLTVRLWCTLSQKENHTLKLDAYGNRDGKPFYQLAFQESSQSLLAASQDVIGQWSMGEKAKFSSISRNENQDFVSAAFSQDSKSLAIGLSSKKVRIQSTSGDELIETPSLDALAQSLAFSTNKRWLAMGLDDGSVHIWDIQNKEMIQSPLDLEKYGEKDKIDSLSFSSDSRLLAAGIDSGYGFIQLWQTSDWQPIGEIKQAHQHRVYNLAFSSDDQFIASSGGDGVARLWTLAQWQQDPLHSQFKHNGRIQSVVFNPKLQQLATGAGDGVVKLWDYSGREIVSIETHQRSVINPKEADIASVAFSSDGKRMATAGADGSVKIWQVGDSEDLAVRNCNWVRDYLKLIALTRAEDDDLCAE